MTLNYKAMGEMIMTSREQAMYGMSTDAIRTQYMESFTAKHSGLKMVDKWEAAEVLQACS